MNDIKVFAKNKRLEVQAIRIYSLYISMEFSAMLRTKSRQRESFKVMELSYQECIRTLEGRENYKYLGILAVDAFKQTEMEKKKNTSEERESFSKPSSSEEISSKG